MSISVPYQKWIPYTSGFLATLVVEEFGSDMNVLPIWDVESDVCWDDKPDALLVSNYIWNQSVNDVIARDFKKRFPGGMVIYGGPNVPNTRSLKPSYFSDRPFVDVFVTGVGGTTLCGILDAYKKGLEPKVGGSIGHDWEMKKDPASGYGRVVYPYLSGLLDHNFEKYDGQQVNVVLEFNRGCPYKCAFCEWGSMTSSKVERFDHDMNIKTIDYITERDNVFKIDIANANYGIFKEDIEYLEYMERRSKERRRNWFVNINMAKSFNKHTRTMLEKLNGMNIAQHNSYRLGVQSHTDSVLSIIDRKNPSIQDIRKHVDFEKALPTSELIQGLPGETVDSWMNNLVREIEIGTRFSRIHHIHMLVNTPMYDPEFVRKYELEVFTWKVPRNFVFWPQGDLFEKIDDAENICVDGGVVESIETLRSTFSYDLEDLKEMNRITVWFKLLSNSKLAYMEMRESSLSLWEQYEMFKDLCCRDNPLADAWSLLNRMLDRIYDSGECVLVRRWTDAAMVMKQPPMLAILYRDIHKTVDVLKSIYPNINMLGILADREYVRRYSLSVDGEIRYVNDRITPGYFNQNGKRPLRVFNSAGQ